MLNAEDLYPVKDLGGIYVQPSYAIWWDKEKAPLILAWMRGASINLAEGVGDNGIVYDALLNQEQYERFAEWLLLAGIVSVS